MPKVTPLQGASSVGQVHGWASEGSLLTCLLHLTQPTFSLANGKAGRMLTASASSWGAWHQAWFWGFCPCFFI